MKRIIIWLSILGFFFLLAGCNLQNATMKERDCSIDQLLLDKSAYPAGTIFDSIHSPIAEKPRESASQSAYYQHDWMGNIAIRYFSAEKAQEIFERHQKSVFHPTEVQGSWEVPSSLDLNDLSADNYQVACGYVISFGSRCILLGQYEEYFIMFNADISDNGINQEEFGRLISKLNNQVLSCLK